jgi:hypothetical protein
MNLSWRRKRWIELLEAWNVFQGRVYLVFPLRHMAQRKIMQVNGFNCECFDEVKAFEKLPGAILIEFSNLVHVK